MEESKGKHLKSVGKKVACSLFAAGLAGSMLPTTAIAATAANYKDGEYEVTGEGFRGLLRVICVFKDGKLTEVRDVSNTDDSSYYLLARDVVEEAIEKQSVDGIDTVSGATTSSKGLLEAMGTAFEIAAGAPTEPDTAIFAGGAGTQADPYLVETADQLAAFASSVTKTVNYQGKYVRLASDIDLSGRQWTPVGGNDYFFEGTFDGADHTIKGDDHRDRQQPPRLFR